jgi:hypothetical protein
VGFGFAAGCAAVAMPRRKTAGLFRGYALGSGLAQIDWAKGRTKGIAQNCKGPLTAGHSHRREANSGGEAEPDDGP